LAEEEFEEAHQFFTDALKMRPDSLEALDGLAQADQGMRLGQIALAQVRATAFEKRELWDRAIQQYFLALNSDDSLEFAKTGLLRARARADLDAKFEGLFRNPDVLFTDQILRDAGMLLEDARGIDGRGPRLNEQITELDRLVRLASTPIDVELHSDGLTNVTLYRVGSLGSFITHHVQIRPGPYTALGSRSGYRDVRVAFEVLPGNTLSPIEIFCVERIN
jgi:tetratricopeptide (TPR) repeat protein